MKICSSCVSSGSGHAGGGEKSVLLLSASEWQAQHNTGPALRGLEIASISSQASESEGTNKKKYTPLFFWFIFFLFLSLSEASFSLFWRWTYVFNQSGRRWRGADVSNTGGSKFPNPPETLLTLTHTHTHTCFHPVSGHGIIPHTFYPYVIYSVAAGGWGSGMW